MTVIVKAKNVWRRIQQNVDIRLKNMGPDKQTKEGIVLLNTALGSDNLGDEIIAHYYSKMITDVFNPEKVYNVATHCKPSEQDIQELLNTEYAVVIGTNFLSPQMELYSGWQFDNKLIKMRNVVLFGVGWWGYKKPSLYSKYVYRRILSKHITHSVRDEQTLKMLNSIGIKNVINTNCLTMLGLEKTCNNIPKEKADKVIFTVTGVMKRREFDQSMIDILQQNYKDIYFWPQGDYDLQYLKTLKNIENITILDRTLAAYTNLLEETSNLDYIGTRLHGGIHAMQNGHRSIIIAIDNRAVEISRDTGLPIIRDNEISDKLNNLINTNWETKIQLNNDLIKEWYSSFSKIKIKY